MRKGNIMVWIIAPLTLLLLIIWILWSNQALELNTISVSHPILPQTFDGFRIAHISDLHNTEMGKNNKRLLTMLQKADPDIIAITGDLIDSRRTNTAVSLAFVREAVKIAPCYYVPGNHESRIDAYPSFRADMEKAGVTVLENCTSEFTYDGSTITILGVADPCFHPNHATENNSDIMDDILTDIPVPQDTFTLLLSHRPELFEVYTKHRIGLVLSGHAHGGQVRLPWIGGILAPNQGFFPKYDSGLYTSGSTNLIVSRGIGNSAFPIRFHNRPEVILVELLAS